MGRPDRTPYGAAWRKARAAYLATHPLCAMCEAQGRITPASVVDHVTPHKGNSALFWNVDNWQPLCKRHHDATKQSADRAEQSGMGCDAQGRPLDAGRRVRWEASIA